MVMVRSGRKTAEVSVIWWLLFSPLPIPLTISQQQTGAVSTVTVYRGERRSQLPPRNFTACFWKDRPHRMDSASIVKGDCLREQFNPGGDGWLMVEPSRLSLWEPAPNVPF